MIGNNGLGKEAALQLAKHNPSHIFIGSRSKEKGAAAIEEITAVVPNANLTMLEIDLGSLVSVHAAVKMFLCLSSRLDILMNNAGIMAVPPQLTTDGYEIQFGTNHLGHALLTKLLLPTLLNTAQSPGSDVRIITLTSDSHQRVPAEGIQFSTLRSAGGAGTALIRYGRSKLANILYTKELARRYPAIKVVSVHPGMVKTGLQTTMRASFLLAKLIAPIYTSMHAVVVEEGVLNQLWATTSMVVESGKLYYPVGEKHPGSVLSRDVDLARKLWEWTEDELASPMYKL